MMRRGLACALLAAVLCAASAQANLLAVLQTGPWELFVDTVTLPTTARGESIPTPNFGGRANTEDTFDFGARPLPPAATVTWLLEGERQRPFQISDIREDRWYDFPVFDADTARIKFVTEGGVEEPWTPGPTPAWAVWPNPFRARVTIRLETETRVRPRVVILDLTGRVVRALRPEAGAREFIWDGRGSDGRRVKPGVYVVRLDAEGFTGTQKLVMQRWY